MVEATNKDNIQMNENNEESKQATGAESRKVVDQAAHPTSYSFKDVQQLLDIKVQGGQGGTFMPSPENFSELATHYKKYIDTAEPNEQAKSPDDVITKTSKAFIKANKDEVLAIIWRESILKHGAATKEVKALQPQMLGFIANFVRQSVSRDNTVAFEHPRTLVPLVKLDQDYASTFTTDAEVSAVVAQALIVIARKMDELKLLIEGWTKDRKALLKQVQEAAPNANRNNREMNDLVMLVLGSICEPRHKSGPLTGTSFTEVDEIFRTVKSKLHFQSKSPFAYVRSADGLSLERLRVASFNEKHWQPKVYKGMVYLCVNIDLRYLEARFKDTSFNLDQEVVERTQCQPHYVSVLSLSLNRECFMLMNDSLISVESTKKDAKRLSKFVTNALNLNHHVLFMQSGSSASLPLYPSAEFDKTPKIALADHKLEDSETFVMTLADSRHHFMESETFTINAQSAPAFQFDAPNTETDGKESSIIRSVVAKSHQTILLERTKRFVSEDKAIERIHIMLQDGLTKTANPLSQTDINLSKPLYSQKYYSKHNIPPIGVYPGLLFRSDLKKALHEHQDSMINRVPAHALNIMLGTDFFRSMQDLIVSNRAPGKNKGGYAYTQFLVDGGVSCLGLESGSRFPYMRADGVFESIQIRRQLRITHKMVPMMRYPLLFNLLLVFFLECKNGLLRVDYLQYCSSANLNQSLGTLQSKLLAVRMINPEDETGSGYMVSIDGGPLVDPFDESDPLKGIFENAVQVQLFQPTAHSPTFIKSLLEQKSMINLTRQANRYGLIPESLRHAFPSNTNEIRCFNQVTKALFRPVQFEKIMRLGTQLRIHSGFFNLQSYSAELQSARQGKLWSNTFVNAQVSNVEIESKQETIKKFTSMPKVPRDLFDHSLTLLYNCQNAFSLAALHMQDFVLNQGNVKQGDFVKGAKVSSNKNWMNQTIEQSCLSTESLKIRNDIVTEQIEFEKELVQCPDSQYKVRKCLITAVREYNQALQDYHNVIDVRVGPQVAPAGGGILAYIDQMKKESNDGEDKEKFFMTQMKKKQDQGYITIIDIDSETTIERPKQEDEISGPQGLLARETKDIASIDSTQKAHIEELIRIIDRLKEEKQRDEYLQRFQSQSKQQESEAATADPDTHMQSMNTTETTQKRAPSPQNQQQLMIDNQLTMDSQSSLTTSEAKLVESLRSRTQKMSDQEEMQNKVILAKQDCFLSRKFSIEHKQQAGFEDYPEKLHGLDIDPSSTNALKTLSKVQIQQKIESLTNVKLKMATTVQKSDYEVSRPGKNIGELNLVGQESEVESASGDREYYSEQVMGDEGNLKLRSQSSQTKLPKQEKNLPSSQQSYRPPQKAQTKHFSSKSSSKDFAEVDQILGEYQTDKLSGDDEEEEEEVDAAMIPVENEGVQLEEEKSQLQEQESQTTEDLSKPADQAKAKEGEVEDEDDKVSTSQEESV